MTGEKGSKDEDAAKKFKVTFTVLMTIFRIQTGHRNSNEGGIQYKAVPKISYVNKKESC